MANAAPNAFGAQLAYPGRQTIALCGDGGYAMLAFGDLLTQVERRTPVYQVILNNDSFDFVKIEQQEAGIVPFGVDFKSPNFAKVTEAMGAKGIRIEEPSEVRDALAEALSFKDGPVVVDAVVDATLRPGLAVARSVSRGERLHIEHGEAGAQQRQDGLNYQDDGTQYQTGLRCCRRVNLDERSLKN